MLDRCVYRVKTGCIDITMRWMKRYRRASIANRIWGHDVGNDLQYSVLWKKESSVEAKTCKIASYAGNAPYVDVVTGHKYHQD